MNHTALKSAVILACLSAAIPARASDDVPEFLKVIGNFVKDGLGPARTAEDVMREERERTAARPEAKPRAQPEPAPVVAQPAPAAPTPEPIAAQQPVRVAAIAAPVAATVAPPPPPPRKTEVSLPAPVPPPPARPAELKPKTIAVAPQPPAEPLTTRIAATATLDQAMRLGGPATLYSQRIKPPVRN
ncbi:hypothetical protein [Magnetospirillum moscoviense]|uniref:Energy transducer TonB n=1 Tax=Magnetospirillum moscoviense TaxID=1437059 RepID=A0A178MTN4_9PROT|nr:hypothetical protein [Magnetospirillum moscoviense]OAN52918.1 hypothetical protein A6A05_10160 [Magnetospirillum moscoviense]